MYANYQQSWHTLNAASLIAGPRLPTTPGPIRGSTGGPKPGTVSRPTPGPQPIRVPWLACGKGWAQIPPALALRGNRANIVWTNGPPPQYPLSAQPSGTAPTASAPPPPMAATLRPPQNPPAAHTGTNSLPTDAYDIQDINSLNGNRIQ